MYDGYFGLREAPFSITPNPRFVFLSRQHQDALAHLLYGIGRGGGGGFVQVTGEVGTGKTTLCRCLLEQLPEEVQVALILNPRLSPAELIASICDELRIRYPRRSSSIKALVDALNRHLLKAHAEGRRVAVVIDEAQNLDRDALEQIRLLTNLETSTQKLLQIILVGQPELRDLLASPDLRQLAQRVTARYHLTPLDAEETAAYVEHRLAVAGAPRRLFTRGALRALFRRSGGVPRLINVMADRALLGAYGLDKARVTGRIVNRAADEVLGTRRRFWSRAVFAAAALAGVAALASAYWPLPRPAPDLDDPRVVLAAPAAHSSAVWGDLLALWGGAPGGTDCGAAVAQGLNCTRLSGNWNSVRTLNRPVILHLRTTGVPGRTIDALLIGLSGTQLRLRLAGEEHLWPISAIDPFWLGDFTVVWSAPFTVTAPLTLGDESAAIAWLKARVSAVGGDVGTQTRNGRFDSSLQAWTQDFQSSQGLAPDGVLGERTWLHLTSRFDEPAQPRLERLPETPGGLNMSYILDALKKSEARRRLGRAPDLMEALPAQVRKPGRGRLILLGILAVLAGGAAGVWLSAGDDPAAPPVTAAADPDGAPVTPVDAAPASSGNEPSAVTFGPDPETSSPAGTASGGRAMRRPRSGQEPPAGPVTAAQHAAPGTDATPAASDGAGNEASASRPREPADTSPEQAPPTAPGEDSPLDALRAEAGERQRRRTEPRAEPEPRGPPPLEAMPYSYRSQLPPMALNVHVYAPRPEERFVLINMARYQEGDPVGGGGIWVVEITPEGAILEYAGREFLLQR